MKLVFVDGFKIRNTLDADFNVLHQKSLDLTDFAPKYYIPDGEIWLDYYFKAEANFLLAVEKAQYSQEKKLKNINALFVDQRRWYEKEQFCKKERAPDFKIKEETVGGLRASYVNGEIVRKYLDPSFVMGGHDLVYSYVPAREIWIDHLMNPADIPHVLVHEVTERKLMEEERDLYEIAHEFATAAEKKSRRKAGGVYPGDRNYPKDWSREKLLKNYYV